MKKAEATQDQCHSKNFSDFLLEKALDQEAIKFLQGKSTSESPAKQNNIWKEPIRRVIQSKPVAK